MRNWGFLPDVSSCKTVEEMLHVSGIGFTVSKRDVWYPTTTDKSYTPTMYNMLMGPRDRHCALVRDDSNTLLATAGGEYHVYQYHDLAELMMTFVQKRVADFVVAGPLRGGRNAVIIMKVPETFSLHNTPIGFHSYMAIMGSHDGKSSIKVWFLNVVPTCWNTLMASIDKSPVVYYIPHRRNIAEKIADVNQAFVALHRYARKLHTYAERLAILKPDTEQLDAYIKQVVPVQEIHRMAGETQEQFNARVDRMLDKVHDERAKLNDLYLNGIGMDVFPGSWWNALNAVTEYQDHFRDFRTSESRFESITFGNAAKRKADAYDLALRMSGIVS